MSDNPVNSLLKEYVIAELAVAINGSTTWTGKRWEFSEATLDGENGQHHEIGVRRRLRKVRKTFGLKPLRLTGEHLSDWDTEEIARLWLDRKPIPSELHP